MKVLCLILARGGSKGIPGKNIKPFCGKPLIAWTIEQALASKYISKTIVSSDSQEIIDVATANGAEAPFVRPAEFAGDTSSRYEAIFHAIDFLEKANENFELLVMLEPTSPLRETKDIDAAIEQLLQNKNGAQSIVGIAEVKSEHPDFLVKIKNGILEPYTKHEGIKMRQEIEPLFFYEGSFYISFIPNLKKYGSFYNEKTMGFLMPRIKAFEIDEQEDFELCELIFANALHKSK